jgi:hypothetical protein
MMRLNSGPPYPAWGRRLILMGCAALGAAAAVVGLQVLAFLGQALDVAWLRDVAINTGPLAVAGGAAAGGAAAAGAAGSGDLPLPAPGAPDPPPPPGQRWDPTTKTYTSGPAPEGPPRSAGPDAQDPTWEVTFSRWVQVIAGSGDRTTKANAGVVN